jgi:hypothetical protein
MIKLAGIGHVLLRVADERRPSDFIATCSAFALPSRTPSMAACS